MTEREVAVLHDQDIIKEMAKGTCWAANQLAIPFGVSRPEMSWRLRRLRRSGYVRTQGYLWTLTDYGRREAEHHND